jgi:hypothetical protein
VSLDYLNDKASLILLIDTTICVWSTEDKEQDNFSNVDATIAHKTETRARSGTLQNKLQARLKPPQGYLPYRLFCTETLRRKPHEA